MTLTEFCGRMGFESAGHIHDSRLENIRPQNYDSDQFWLQITGKRDYSSKNAKASKIHNPVLRYLHRVMACTIFGRGEPGTVRADELFLLWAMMHKCQVNTGYYLLSHLAQVAESTSGKIAVGGVVTYIAEHLGMDLSEEHQGLDGGDEIDINTCIQMRIIKPFDVNRQRFRLLISDKDSILLPNPDKTNILVPENLLYLDAAPQEQEEQLDQEDHMMDEEAEQQPAQGGHEMPDWYASMMTEMQRVSTAQERLSTDVRELRVGQQRQDARIEEIIRSEQRQEEMLARMMQSMHLQYPPPGQQ